MKLKVVVVDRHHSTNLNFKKALENHPLIEKFRFRDRVSKKSFPHYVLKSIDAILVNVIGQRLEDLLVMPSLIQHDLLIPICVDESTEEYPPFGYVDYIRIYVRGKADIFNNKRPLKEMVFRGSDLMRELHRVGFITMVSLNYGTAVQKHDAYQDLVTSGVLSRSDLVPNTQFRQTAEFEAFVERPIAKIGKRELDAIVNHYCLSKGIPKYLLTQEGMTKLAAAYVNEIMDHI